MLVDSKHCLKKPSKTKRKTKIMCIRIKNTTLPLFFTPKPVFLPSTQNIKIVDLSNFFFADALMKKKIVSLTLRELCNI